ncbi:MAG: type II toxin-antitoxin system VapC family toxin [Hymenobacter sp.]|nr:MAG: type II toxin-antitoxin system VapC family toxin [Hymenobacter sp.]
MLLDTNLVIRYIRQGALVPADTVISVIVAAELEAFALKLDWGYQKVYVMRTILERFKPIGISEELIPDYAFLDAYSQGKLKDLPLPPGLSARNMGKNDLWIAATALYFDVELHTSDNDFDHLGPASVRVVKA